MIQTTSKKVDIVDPTGRAIRVYPSEVRHSLSPC